MPALGKALDRFEPLFLQRGFTKQNALDRGPLFQNAERHFVRYDRIRGGHLRLFLGIPGTDGVDSPEIYAESPSWRTKRGETLEDAVQHSWEFLEPCGFSFLANPLSLTPTEWRVRHNLLVRDRRIRSIHVTWPPAWKLNQLVMSSKRCIPGYANMAALKLRNLLAKSTSLSILKTPLADALELKISIEAHGFHVEIQEG